MSKDADRSELLDAIQTVLNGHVWVGAEIADRILTRISRGENPEDSPVENLSEQQRKMLSLIGQGTATREIAARLQISHKTVESKRERLKQKLNLKDGTELTRYAVRWMLQQRRHAAAQTGRAGIRHG